jgi:serine/threonine-protein kinase
MAPEQYLPGAEVTPAADIYALGLLAYTLLVGTDYWHEELARDENVFVFALIAMKGTIEAPSLRALRVAEMPLSPGFDGWFAKATALSPSARFATASEAVRELAIALRVNLPPARPTAPSLQGLIPELSIPDLAHSSRTTPAGSAATMQLRPSHSKKRWVVAGAAGSLLAIGMAAMALRSGTAGSGQAAAQVAVAQPDPAPVPEAVRTPLPADTVASAAELDSKTAEAAQLAAHPGSAAAKARAKTSKSGPGTTPAKPAPKPVYSRD